MSIILKLITYELAALYNRSNSYAAKRIAAYEETNTPLLELINDATNEGKDIDAIKIANDIFNFFKEEDDKRKAKEDADRKKSKDEMKIRYDKIINKLKNEPPKVYISHSLEYQLGIMIGDFIISKYLPTLSTDSIYTNYIIDVSQDDTIENERLYDLWYNSNSNNSFQELSEHSIKLKNKYLSPILECYVPRISSVTNEQDLIKGINDSLWGCDCSYYTTDGIEFINNDRIFNTMICLKLSND